MNEDHLVADHDGDIQQRVQAARNRRAAALERARLRVGLTILASPTLVSKDTF
jgi:hypothetical protein